jgi:hypothetical protein
VPTSEPHQAPVRRAGPAAPHMTQTSRTANPETPPTRKAPKDTTRPP